MEIALWKSALSGVPMRMTHLNLWGQEDFAYWYRYCESRLLLNDPECRDGEG